MLWDGALMSKHDWIWAAAMAAWWLSGFGVGYAECLWRWRRSVDQVTDQVRRLRDMADGEESQ